MSYTDEEKNKMVEMYSANPTKETVEKISEELGKSMRSVVAKLSSEGVYQTPKRTTKTGEDIVKKDELVADISNWLGIEAESLIKTGKQDLKNLHQAIKLMLEEEKEYRIMQAEFRGET